MSEPKVIDKRNEPRPEKQKFHVYPTCKTCKYFDNFVNAATGVVEYTICVINPPVVTAQIRGMNDEGHVIWASRSEWPFVTPNQRCGKHADREAN